MPVCHRAVSRDRIGIGFCFSFSLDRLGHGTQIVKRNAFADVIAAVPIPDRHSQRIPGCYCFLNSSPDQIILRHVLGNGHRLCGSLVIEYLAIFTCYGFTLQIPGRGFFFYIRHCCDFCICSQPVIGCLEGCHDGLLSRDVALLVLDIFIDGFLIIVKFIHFHPGNLLLDDYFPLNRFSFLILVLCFGIINELVFHQRIIIVVQNTDNLCFCRKAAVRILRPDILLVIELNLYFLSGFILFRYINILFSIGSLCRQNYGSPDNLFFVVQRFIDFEVICAIDLQVGRLGRGKAEVFTQPVAPYGLGFSCLNLVPILIRPVAAVLILFPDRIVCLVYQIGDQRVRMIAHSGSAAAGQRGGGYGHHAGIMAIAFIRYLLVMVIGAAGTCISGLEAGIDGLRPSFDTVLVADIHGKLADDRCRLAPGGRFGGSVSIRGCVPVRRYHRLAQGEEAEELDAVTIHRHENILLLIHGVELYIVA